MANEILILSSEKNFTNSLALYFKNKDLVVRISKTIDNICENTKYLVILNLKNEWGRKKKIVDYLNKYSPKTVVVNSLKQPFFGDSLHLKRIVVDNIFPYFVKEIKYLCEKARNNKVFLPAHAWVGVATESQLMDKISEELFSFKRENEFFFGKLYSYHEIVNKFNPLAEIKVSPSIPNRLPPNNLKVIEPAIALQDILSSVNDSTVKRKLLAPNVRLNNMRWLSLPFLVFFILIITPYFLLLVSGIASGVAYKALMSGNLSFSRKSVYYASKSAKAGYRLIEFAKLPMIKTAENLNIAADAASRVLGVSDYAFEFANLAGKSEGKNILHLIHLELSALYNELSFAKPEGILGEVIKYRKHILAASEIARYMPDILGYEKPKTYLILLQNNMELRPTGGFIGSFALLTFSKGELIDNTIYDVYSADGQLKGYIAPPKPIEEHLGEASWSLRDSNWDPNFPSSAKRAEWFLDKTIDREVDGVVAINLEVARDFLEVLGGVNLPDFNHVVDSKNMYERVQHEVEDGFFPGSRKKAHYLSALMTAVLQQLKTASYSQYISLILSMIDRLDSRDLQVYLKGPVQEVFKNHGWGGEVVFKNCQGNCASIFAGIVEANLGVNKANYYVQRKAHLKVDLKPDIVDYELSVDLINNAFEGQSIPEKRYKVYIRALALDSSTFREAFVRSNESLKYLDVDIENLDGRKEYGVLLEILPGEKKQINIKWSSPVNLDFSKKGDIYLNWWKQSGVEYPFEVSVNIPFNGVVKTFPAPSLTKGGTYYYNTTLNKDFAAVLKWQ